MGKDNSADQAAAQAADAQTKLAQQLVSQSDPTRRALFQDANQFLSGDRDVTALPEFGAFKNSAESQFGRARDAIIANTPEGGGLTAALAGLEGQRAGNQAGFTGALAGDEVNRAIQLATFGAAAGSQGLSSAGFLQGQRAQSQSAQNAGKSQGLGTAAGVTAATIATKGAGTPAAAAAFTSPSDRRLKKNIEHIGMYGPHNLYSFDYLDGTHSVGVMAQEMPDKYVTESGGYLMVDYGMLSHG